MPGSLAPRGPPAASFAALLQTAYESEGALLDEQVQAQLRAALPHVPMPRLLCSAKHLLLYLRSTVENFGQVSAAPLSRRPRVSPHLCLQSGTLESGPDDLAVLVESHCHPVAHEETS